jgi:SnoaL-like domain
MDDAARRAQIEGYLRASGVDQEAAHAMYHPDAVLEFPQSGERFDGVENFRAWRTGYPSDVDFELRELRGDGELWVAEVAIRYDGGPWQLGVSVIQYRGDKVARETIYVTEPWEAPEWRARWRSAP